MALGYDCDHCSKNTQIVPELAVIHDFEVQWWYSYAEVTCPGCGTTARVFMRDIYQQAMEVFVTQGFSFVTEDYPSDEIIQAFCRTFGITLAKEYKLTRRMEEEANNLADVLEHIPDDLLWDILTLPSPPQELPQEWT